MQITKQQAGLLYGNSYLLQHVESGKIYSIKRLAESWIDIFEGTSFSNTITIEEIGSTYKILARRNDLTKPIIVEGKEVVPLLKLANIAFPGYDLFPFIISEQTKNAYNKQGHSFYYSELGESFFARFDDKSIGVQNQADLFEWLQSHNFRGNLPKELVTYNDDVYNS